MGEETEADKKFQQAFENLKSDKVESDSAEQKVNSPRIKIHSMASSVRLAIA